MILGARIANRTPGAEIDGELRLTGRYSGSRVRISPEKTTDCLTAASFAMPSQLRVAIYHGSRLCLARIKSALEMNNIQRGRVTCYMEDIQLLRSFGEGQHLRLWGGQKKRQCEIVPVRYLSGLFHIRRDDHGFTFAGRRVSSMAFRGAAKSVARRPQVAANDNHNPGTARFPVT
jgi:hypothetical protein